MKAGLLLSAMLLLASSALALQTQTAILGYSNDVTGDWSITNAIAIGLTSATSCVFSVSKSVSKVLATLDTSKTQSCIMTFDEHSQLLSLGQCNFVPVFSLKKCVAQ